MSVKRFSIGKLVAVLFVAAWVVVALLFAWRLIGHKSPSLPTDAKSLQIPEEEWYSLLFHGEKAGWVHNTYDELPSGGYRFKSTSLLKLQALGTVQEANIFMDAEVNSDFKLKKFALDFSSAMQTIQVEGEVEGRKITYRLKSPNSRKPIEQTVTVKEPPSLTDMLGRYAAQQGLEVGQTFSVPSFDPITQASDSAEAEVLRKEKIDTGSGVVDAYVVSVKILGMEMTSWMDEDGKVLKSDTPMGFTVVLTDKEEALSLDGSGKIDVVAASAAPADKMIPDPRDLKYLKVKLRGVDDLEGLALDGDDQSLDGDVLTVSIPEPRNGYRLPDNDPARAAERSPEPMIQSDNPEIIKVAREASRGATDSIDAARNINRWVFKNLEKAGAFTLPSALDVLETRKGDCNEHTQLFVALARAVGLPARVAAGVVYLNGAFYYHAWPEIWVGEDSGWVPIDPTFGQFPADATHLRMVNGTLREQADIVRFVRRLKVDVVDFR